MDYYQIGKVIRELRVQQEFTQKELASTTCTQGQLSKIEKGEVIPTASTLYELAQRLGVSTDFIFKKASASRADYVSQTFEVVRQLIRERNYEQVSSILRAERNNEQFTEPRAKQFMMWHQGIVKYYVERDVEAAISLLRESLHVDDRGPKSYSERTVEILNSLAIIQMEEERFEESIHTFKECLMLLTKAPHLEDVHIKIRVLYNLAKSCYRSQRFAEAIQFCNQGITACKREETMYLLGELYVQLALSLEETGKMTKAKLAFEKALYVFTLQDNRAFLEVVQKRMQES
ncbi:MAG TPA: helix-turn-helix domain-containing protein [Bacilli bacterium]|nr:helix-turn-helix domain-containing protein [Bacilli bacterium]